MYHVVQSVPEAFLPNTEWYDRPGPLDSLAVADEADASMSLEWGGVYGADHCACGGGVDAEKAREATVRKLTEEVATLRAEGRSGKLALVTRGVGTH